MSAESEKVIGRGRGTRWRNTEEEEEGGEERIASALITTGCFSEMSGGLQNGQRLILFALPAVIT